MGYSIDDAGNDARGRMLALAAAENAKLGIGGPV